MVARRELNDPPFKVSALPASGTPKSVQKSGLSFCCDQMGTIRLSFVERIDCKITLMQIPRSIRLA